MSVPVEKEAGISGLGISRGWMCPGRGHIFMGWYVHCWLFTNTSLLSISQVGFNSWYWLHCHSSLRISRTTIENLRCQLCGEIIRVIFRKFVISLGKQLKKQLVHKNCATGYWFPFSFFFKFILKFLDQRCHKFSEGYPNNFSTELPSQNFDCCIF